jgi:O-acetyl-ADP-ribose deacetylase (regulator of RNase III)
LITYTTGDLLNSHTEALVNTVNCEGYMGKGIAYQFKLKFPDNNKEYIKACRSGELRIGKLHYSEENGKIVINFPTKDKWRAKSKMSYIEQGMDALVNLIDQLKIKSISIPPLGSGNGGLVWGEVKPLIERKLKAVTSSVNVYIFEPSQNYVSRPTTEPKLSTSALILMEIKNQLQQFNNDRLQKAAFLVNILSANGYFKFQKQKNGPYDNTITIISRSIKAFQMYHNVSDTQEAKAILYNKIVSESVVSKYTTLIPIILRSCGFINNIKLDHELECLTILLFLIDENGIETLLKAKIIERTLIGYAVQKEWTAFNGANNSL